MKLVNIAGRKMRILKIGLINLMGKIVDGPRLAGGLKGRVGDGALKIV